jgi:Asp-tRNA(Asn)/Glu-tRNA(Gln) amidotransferase A subunit family amidase
MDASLYDLESVKLPYFSGFQLRQFVSLIESPLSRFIIPQLMENAGITTFRKLQYDDTPVVYPLEYVGSLNPGRYDSSEACRSVAEVLSEKNSTDFQFVSAQDYTAAYRNGLTTPLIVAENVIAAIEQSNNSNPPLRAIIASYADDIIKQAEASAERYASGKSLGPLDGVPITIKDEFDMVPYPTTVGTKFLGSQPAKEDSTVVARLREVGAILIGKGNMHEVGIGVTGLNPHHGTARNPYNVDHYTGGSSSGPASAVASGLSPIALGADGGGSIRIPSAFCGLVGLKPTFGRVSEYGAAPLTWSMAHIGPIGATTADVAISYAAIAGPDPKDTMSWHQPLPEVLGWENGNIAGITLGVYWPWFRHASSVVVQACENMLKEFEKLGARVCNVTLPDLEAARVAHLIIIAGEIAQNMDRYAAEHGKDFSLEVRTNLALARSFNSYDFILSQRVRSRLINNIKQAHKKADVIITPTTGLTAPRIPAKALPDGDSDLTTVIEIMRFAPVPNLTGNPAISFPVGYVSNNLPIGMQAIGRAWDEMTLLRIAQAAENIVLRKKPQVYYQLLDV